MFQMDSVIFCLFHSVLCKLYFPYHYVACCMLPCCISPCCICCILSCCMLHIAMLYITMLFAAYHHVAFCKSLCCILLITMLYVAYHHVAYHHVAYHHVADVEYHNVADVAYHHVAHVVGAGTGIGEACAVEFSMNNYNVVITGRRKEKLLNTQLMCVLHGALQQNVTTLCQVFFTYYKDKNFILYSPIMNNQTIFFLKLCM